ncbi:MAG: DHH family phosphoesterase, partial [Gammaproteobacteria bacterium]|nr:DHH family phosphoesterase [Gammaproteobacteria bacterium]
MKRWKVLEQAPEARTELANSLHLNPLIAQILINRGICTAGQIEKFLDPKLSHLSDPFDIPGIQKAAQRIFEAKEKQQKVLVYGDYDVDGVTGTTVLLETLKHMGIHTTYYIPFRYGEGYSLNMEAIKKIKREKVDLIVTVDCGISSKKEIELANSLGIDVIVTDHHNLPEELPPALAVINPKMIKSEHPTKDLAGVGVAFKFAWGLLRLAGIRDREFLTELLDMVSLGTIADIVPLTAENRILTVHGLRYLNGKKRMGIKFLTEAASIYKKLS